MRISVLGYFRGDSSQNTVRIAQSWTLQGHIVQCLDFGVPNVITKILAYKPKFVLVTMGRDFDHSPLIQLKNSGIFLVNWIPDEYGPKDGIGGEWFEKIKGIYNLFMVETRGLVSILENYADDVIWIPQFFDSLYHTVRGPKDIQPKWDIGFLGGPNFEQSSIRLKFLKYLIQDGYDIKLAGGKTSWTSLCGIEIPSNFFLVDREIIGADMALFYKYTRIGVNFLNDKLPQYDLALSNRAFKTLGCGCFLLTQEIEGLQDLLIPGKHCITYKGDDYNDFKTKIDYYLNNPKERQKIATIGQRHVLNNYNIDKITAGFIDEIKKRL